MGLDDELFIFIVALSFGIYLPNLTEKLMYKNGLTQLLMLDKAKRTARLKAITLSIE